MQRRMVIGGGLALVGTVAAGFGAWRYWRGAPGLPAPRTPVDRADFEAAVKPLVPPEGPLRTYHLGHSLVGRDMPAMLAQLAGHDHASQLGWGASLRQHWEDRLEIPGFAVENAHPHFRPAKDALASGDYDAVVLTEMVELRDAIRWHASPHYLARWAEAARKGNPDVRLYLYETWHRMDDPEGFLPRIANDLPALWEGELQRGAMAWGQAPLHLIPAGKTLKSAIKAVEAGEIPGVSQREAFFTRAPDGTQDMIHPSDLGAYLVALVHYAVLYHRAPLGLPHVLARADGSPVEFGADTAAALQALVWDVVLTTPRTGVSL